MVTVGEKLKMLREQRGWTQTQAADKLGVSSQVISNYERDYRSPDKETLSKIAVIYNRSLDWILGVTEDEQSPTASTAIKDQGNKEQNVSGGRAYFGGSDQYTEEELDVAKAAIEAYRKIKRKDK
ncbi:HTH-type transcriptional regulator ImmR [compost metagenome]